MTQGLGANLTKVYDGQPGQRTKHRKRPSRISSRNYAKKLSSAGGRGLLLRFTVAPVQADQQIRGKSYYDLLNSVRIEKAKELLADPSLPKTARHR